MTIGRPAYIIAIIAVCTCVLAVPAVQAITAAGNIVGVVLDSAVKPLAGRK